MADGITVMTMVWNRPPQPRQKRILTNTTLVKLVFTDVEPTCAGSAVLHLSESELISHVRPDLIGHQKQVGKSVELVNRCAQ